MTESYLSPTTRDFTLDAAARRELLESHNQLRSAMQTLWECNDLWISDLRNLEKLMFRMQDTLKFERCLENSNSDNWCWQKKTSPHRKNVDGQRKPLDG